MININNRLCTRCNTLLEENSNNFYVNKKGEFAGICKECRKDYQRIYKNNNKDKCKASNDTWISNNKAHISEYKKKHIEQNKDKYRNNLKKWQTNNQDRVKEHTIKYSNKKHNISNEEWIKCKMHFNYNCAY